MALMDKKPGPSVQGFAIASGALLAALMDRLVGKGVISKSDARAVIDLAKAGLQPFEGHDAHIDAVAFLHALGEQVAP
jgi:hypothetical protein